MGQPRHLALDIALGERRAVETKYPANAAHTIRRTFPRSRERIRGIRKRMAIRFRRNWAQATIENLVEQPTPLYEQGRRERRKPRPIGRYVRRWLEWADGGMTETGIQEGLVSYL
jgi:hypothetical protein